MNPCLSVHVSVRVSQNWAFCIPLCVSPSPPCAFLWAPPPGNRDNETLGHWNTLTPGHRFTRTLENWTLGWTLGHQDSGTPGQWDTTTVAYQNTRTLAHLPQPCCNFLRLSSLFSSSLLFMSSIFSRLSTFLVICIFVIYFILKLLSFFRSSAFSGPLARRGEGVLKS